MTNRLHVLVVTEEDRQVHGGAYSTEADSRQAWRQFVIDTARPSTALDDELRDLALLDYQEAGWPIADVVDQLNDIDLIEWWRSRDDGNDVWFREVTDHR